jgi:hypothetical protein
MRMSSTSRKCSSSNALTTCLHPPPHAPPPHDAPPQVLPHDFLIQGMVGT